MSGKPFTSLKEIKAIKGGTRKRSPIGRTCIPFRTREKGKCYTSVYIKRLSVIRQCRPRYKIGIYQHFSQYDDQYVISNVIIS